ncbi:MAG TPA: trypsin-like peptidase domain-containing protein [Herpetosiphonaceae bacterium]|nr:trypsin-like peptidase domain-containing protein [Herpetosiphonaceae bacterium]
MKRYVGRRTMSAFLLLNILLLAGCDVAEQGSTTGQGEQSTTGQGAVTAPEPTRRSSAPLGDSQIGGAGVALAQAEPTPTLIPASEQQALTEYEQVINNVYRRTINGVVNLTDGQGTGSGYIIDREGHIVTNNHVVGQMQEIYITFADRTTARGQLIGTFPEGDIAIVRAEQLPPGATPVELGDSGTLQVGQIVVAVGSPLGLEQTVTSGIVSALNRSISEISRQESEDSSLQGLIQTDAAINPGNSGGPLFDSRGRVIGMNTLIATRAQSSETAGNIGLGFAVPVNRVKRVARQIIETGQYERPRLGISVFRILPQIAQQLNLPTTSGVMIGEVTAGGPADRAGLQGATRGAQINGQQYPVDGDIIIAINDVPVRSTGDLRNVLETQADPGDTVTVTYLREGREQQAQVTLQ